MCVKRLFTRLRKARVSEHVRRFCLLLVLAFAGVAGATPEIQHWQTSKGARVFFVELQELPIIDIQLVFAAGSSREPAHRRGVALLTNSLLAEGAGGLDADTISFEFERLGAQFGTDASYDSASLSLRSLVDESLLTPALINFRRVVSAPDFPDSALERQRKRLLVAIQQKKQSPQALAGDAFAAAAFGEHPYAFPVEGNEDSVRRIGRADVTAFHQRYYSARNALVAIVGAVPRAQAEMIAEELTGALPTGEAAAPVPAVPPLTMPTVIRNNHPSAQMHILVGQPGMKRGDPDYFPLYVGNHILGGSGLVSQLFAEVREKRGLSYSAYSYFSPRAENGPFVAGLQTRADQAQAALKVLRQTLQAFIDNGPGADELKRAKQNITGGFPLRIDSNSKILGYIAMIGFYGLPLDYLARFNERIEAVTAAQIRDAFKRRVHPGRMVTVMVGPLDRAATE